MNEKTINNMLYFGWDMFPGEIIISLFVMLIICILSFVIYFVFKKKDPTVPHKGFVMAMVFIVESIENFTVELMGKKWKHFSGYALGLSCYIIFCFLASLLGLPGPLTYLGVTFSIALCTFAMIHFTAMKKNKWGYFKRYIDPSPVFLPINLLSMWAPLLSLVLRLFGNALAGFTLMSIVYYFLGAASNAIFGGFISSGAASIILPPLVTPILHMYFDVFSGAIQTLIFLMLTMIFISNEDEEEESGEYIEKAQSIKA